MSGLGRTRGTGHGDGDAVLNQEMREGRDVGEERQIFEGQRLIGQERRRHQRQRGILGATDRYLPHERLAAANSYSVHSTPPGPLASANNLVDEH